MKPTILLYGQGTYENYIAALEAAGGGVCREVHQAPQCAGLLLPGGGDIVGILDEPEYLLIQSLISDNRPILGICRGMQALNVYFGGTLYDRIPGHQKPQGDLVHPTRARGLLAELLGTQPVVNSNHHQAVRTLGEGLQVVQQADDGVIEGVCHRELPIWGVQWHPERQSYCLRRDDAADAAPLFEAFLAQMR